MESLARVKLLIGDKGIDKLKKMNVFVFGVGGVGSYCAEALARSGVGNINLIDYDKIEESNLNRQIQTDYSVLGEYKAEIMKNRISLYNSFTNVLVWNVKYPDPKLKEALKSADYIADCIDMVSAKMDLIEYANINDIPIISSMGTANKMYPNKLEIGDIYKTEYCPLAKVVRKECRKRNIKKLKVVYSKEKSLIPVDENTKESKRTNGTMIYVPAVAGMMMASEIINLWIEEFVKWNK